jgi:hypothetical protein
MLWVTARSPFIPAYKISSSLRHCAVHDWTSFRHEGHALIPELTACFSSLCTNWNRNYSEFSIMNHNKRMTGICAQRMESSFLLLVCFIVQHATTRAVYLSRLI